MPKLVVGALVLVIEVSRVKRVRSRERVVDLGLFLLDLPHLLPLLVAVHETAAVSSAVEVILVVNAAVTV